MEPGPDQVQLDNERKFRELISNPSKDLWLWDLQLCLEGEWLRNVQYEHLGNLSGRYDDILERVHEKENALKTLVMAIEQLLETHNPQQISPNVRKTSMILDLIGKFTPPSGFDWVVRMLNTLSMPTSETPRVIGGEDIHLQALHALESYQGKLPEQLLPVYLDILKKYANSGNSWYASYALRTLGQLGMV